MLQFLGQNLDRLRDLYAGLSVQPGFLQTGSPVVAASGFVKVPPFRALAGPQARSTGETAKLVAESALTQAWRRLNRENERNFPGTVSEIWAPTP